MLEVCCAGAGGLEEAESAVVGLVTAGGAAAASDGVEMMGTSTVFCFFRFFLFSGLREHYDHGGSERSCPCCPREKRKKKRRRKGPRKKKRARKEKSLKQALARLRWGGSTKKAKEDERKKKEKSGLESSRHGLSHDTELEKHACCAPERKKSLRRGPRCGAKIERRKKESEFFFFAQSVQPSTIDLGETTSTTHPRPLRRRPSSLRP